MGDRLGIPRVVDFSFSRAFHFSSMHFFLISPARFATGAAGKHNQLFPQIASLKREAENMRNARKNDRGLNITTELSR